MRRPLPEGKSRNWPRSYSTHRFCNCNQGVFPAATCPVENAFDAFGEENAKEVRQPKKARQ